MNLSDWNVTTFNGPPAMKRWTYELNLGTVLLDTVVGSSKYELMVSRVGYTKISAKFRAKTEKHALHTAQKHVLIELRERLDFLIEDLRNVRAL